MGILFSSLFWGIFLLLLGASILLKLFFHVEIPVFRTFFGLALVFLGVQVLLGGSPKGGDGRQAAFGATHVAAPKPGSKVDVVFGKGVLDLKDVAWDGAASGLEANTVFGSTLLKLDPKVPTLVKATAAFAAARFPDGNLVSFGEYSYRNKAYKEGKPCLTVKASVVFGDLEVEE